MITFIIVSKTAFTALIAVLTTFLIPSQTEEVNCLITPQIRSQVSLIASSFSLTNVFTASIAPLIVSLISSHIWIAYSFTVSQCLYKKTPAATRPVIARTTKPIGLVRNAIAAPNAVVSVVATVHTAFHATVAAVITPCATASAAFAAVFKAN